MENGEVLLAWSFLLMPNFRTAIENGGANQTGIMFTVVSARRLADAEVHRGNSIATERACFPVTGE